MKKLLKFVAFVAAAGAAVAGLMYFLDRKKQDEFFLEDDELDANPAADAERTYVSLDTAEEEAIEAEAAAKKSLKETVKSVAQDMKQKAEDAAKGVGLVKSEEKNEASDFAFESFDKKEEQE